MGIGWGMASRKKPIAPRPEVPWQQIADELGVSRVTIAQIEKSALRKLREALKAKGYKLEDFFGKD